MKITYCKTAAILFGALTLMTSCDNDDDGDGDGLNNQFDSTDVTSLQNAAQNGSWRITRFVDDGEDETSVFDGFVFSFGTDGSISADNGTNLFNGTWRVELDDDDDDDDMDDNDDLEFYLTFSTSNEDFDDLTEDWEVLEFSDTRIRLGDDDDDDDDDLLTFERN